VSAAAAAQDPGDAGNPCAGDPSCREVSAAELFALADAAAAEGDLDGAEAMLVALTGDPDPDLRAEARFRLAALREKRGDQAGAVEALKALLAEKPDAQRARLELGRILAMRGDDAGARQTLREAQAAGLPADVAWTVRRFSTALRSLAKRGGSIEMALGIDSNVNRSTADKFISTIIAPFELLPDARRQAGIGVSLSGEGYSRDRILGATWLTRIGASGELFAGKSRFNDVQASLTSGPELAAGAGRIRPAFVYERRWYGGDRYSEGYGGGVNWLTPAGARGQLQLDASIVRQAINDNRVLDGERYALAASYDHIFSPRTSARMTLRGAALDAAVRPESLRQGGADALVAHDLSPMTLFAQIGYTRTEGRAPIFLFGRTRADDRFDAIAGAVVHRLAIGGFVPLARITYTHSRSNIALYDYRRARFDLGLTRQF
jgi:tetratricopeptide (TPR) repeat protein